MSNAGGPSHRLALQDQRLLTLDGQRPDVLPDVGAKGLGLMPFLVEPAALQLQLIATPLKIPQEQ
jgi:hypothetical protein